MYRKYNWINIYNIREYRVIMENKITNDSGDIEYINSYIIWKTTINDGWMNINLLNKWMIIQERKITSIKSNNLS